MKIIGYNAWMQNPERSIEQRVRNFLNVTAKRRDVLALGSAAAGVVLDRTVIPQLIPETTRETIFGNGDTFETPLGPVKIDNWKLRLQNPDLRADLNRNFFREYTYTLYFPEQGEVDSSLLQINRLQTRSAPSLEDARTVIGVAGTSSNKGYLIVEVDNRGEKEHIFAYPIQLDAAEVISDPNTQERGLLYFEPGAQIATEMQTDLVNLITDFTGFAGYVPRRPTMYIIKAPDETLPNTNFKDKVFYYSQETFTNEKYPKEALMQITRTLANLAYSEAPMFRSTTELRQAAITFLGNHSSLINGIREQLGDDIKRIIDHPMLTVFDHVRYFTNRVNLFEGSLYDEIIFLASATTTLRYLPDEFMQRVSELDEVYQGPAKEIARNVLLVVQAMSGGAEEIIPEYQKLLVFTAQ